MYKIALISRFGDPLEVRKCLFAWPQASLNVYRVPTLITKSLVINNPKSNRSAE